MRTWTKSQKDYCCYIVVLLFTAGYLACLIDTMGDTRWKNVAAVLFLLGLGMVWNNLSAMYGLVDRKPSLGGGLIWFLASVQVNAVLDLDPFLASWITVGMTMPFFFHWYLNHNDPHRN